MNKYKTRSTGFTLIEMAVVIVIGGILMVAGAILLRNYLYQSRTLATQSRLQDIDNAIVQYVNVNGMLPCVASLTDAESSATYGQQIAVLPTPVASYCSGAVGGGSFSTSGEVPGALGPPKDNRSPTTNTTGTVVVGAVPVRALGLPDEDITDAWGDRFVYAVTDALTVPTTYDPSQGSITVQDGKGTDVAVPSGSAQYVLVSYGADRAGAYTIAGVLGTACPPAGALETPNCTLPPAGKMTFIKTTQNSSSNVTGANLYDDYVIFHNQLMSAGILPSGIVAPFAPLSSTSVPVCPAGWGMVCPAAGCPSPAPPAAAACPSACPAGPATTACICCEK